MKVAVFFSCGIGKSLFPIPQKITLHRKNILKSLLLFFDQKTTLHFIYNFDMIVHNKSREMKKEKITFIVIMDIIHMWEKTSM